jgi:hypothetical protein
VGFPSLRRGFDSLHPLHPLFISLYGRFALQKGHFGKENGKVSSHVNDVS